MPTDYRPVSTWKGLNTSLSTFQDAVVHLLDLHDVDRSGRVQRIIRGSVLRAYRDMPHYHNWSYFFNRFHLVTVAQQTAGTIAYDHTGGTNERELTLTGSTWPSFVRQGTVIIANNHYDIDESISSTIVTLANHSNPGADIVASTAYILYQDGYSLPVDFARAGRLMDVVNRDWLEHVNVDDYLSKTRQWSSPGYPLCYTFMNSPEFFASLALFLSPAPELSRTYDFVYQRQARELLTEKESTGTVTVAAGSTTVTGAGTAFAARHVGSVLRLSADGVNEPTGLTGDLLNDNPFAVQRTITAVASATSCTIDSEADATVTFTDVKFTISDPLDIETGSMLTAFHRLAEAEAARQMQREDRLEKEAVAMQALQVAINADTRSFAKSPDQPSAPPTVPALALSSQGLGPDGVLAQIQQAGR